MKKILTLTAVCALAVVSAHAQGTVFFGNGNTTKVSTNSVATATAGDTTTVTGIGANSYYYALFFSTSAANVGGATTAVIGTNGVYVFNAANSASWTLATAQGGGQLFGANTATTGRLQSNTADASAVTQIGNLAGGTSAQFLMLGWSSNIGTTLASVIAWYNNGQPNSTGWLGESVVTGAITPGILNTTPTASLWGTGAGFINGFTVGQVNAVPEPGTLALAALGSASLLLFRRKK